ncbi:MAG: O-antigen ligase family protein, partial [Cytophagales bacterium]|nr:O-antigen ligase family protein [Cytophagales bacterium]
IIPFGIAVITLVFYNPKYGIYGIIFVAEFVVGLGRYIPGPLGLLIDFLLLISLFSCLLRIQKVNTDNPKNILFGLISLWFLYCILELANPEAPTLEAWFYAVRAQSLYLFFITLLGFWIFYTKREITNFIEMTVLFSLLGALNGIRQLHIGLDRFESEWLAGAVSTHLIFGKLRVFSFYADAGVFGAVMGFILVVSVVLAVHSEKFWRKVYLWFVAVCSAYGLAISGTRGAVFIPLVGFIVYLVHIKKVRVLIVGGILLASVFVFLKFTNIGQANYNIQRLRSAVRPGEDISFQVRLNNQRKLSEYMETRPFGGGIGSIGYWGKKFAPESFLANLPPDSWYVWLWGDTGVVGLVIYFSIILYFLIKNFFKLFAMEMNDDKVQLIALYCPLVGMFVASYGNPVIGQ